jgi:hypothetical protein
MAGGLRTLRVLLVAALVFFSGCSFKQSLPGVDNVIDIDYAKVLRKGPAYYGVEYSWIDQDKELFLDRYRRLHGNTVRVQVSQEIFESLAASPKDGRINFSRPIVIDRETGKTMTYEMMFKTLASMLPDMNFQINLWLCSRSNSPAPDGYLGLGGGFPPKDYARHRVFVRELAYWLVHKCGIHPDHLSFTFVNEPNLKPFFVGTEADLVRMAKETRSALDSVSRSIRMGGLDEVHGISWTESFYEQRPRGCCDFWTFHVYERGEPAVWAALADRLGRLRKYGPVCITEFADTTYGSPDGKMDFSGREAALEFADILGRLWSSGIDGIIHFRLSDTYTDRFGPNQWVGHGLMADSMGTHNKGEPYKPFPVYWVFANMYRELGGCEIVQTTSPSGLSVVSARKKRENGAHLAVWIVNRAKEKSMVEVRVSGFPAGAVRVQTLDNLKGDAPIDSRRITGNKLTFKVDMPRESSYLLTADSLF